MKIILGLITLVFIIGKPPVKPIYACDIHTVVQAVPLVIWYEQTIDGSGQAPIVTRLIHNKYNIFTAQLAKCYANTVNPLEVYRSIGIFGLSFWLYFIYEVAVKKKWLFLALFLTVPVIPIFHPDTQTAGYTYKIIAIAGLLYIFKKIE